jgi:hypothetical protein
MDREVQVIREGEVKSVGKSGQISLGKRYAGKRHDLGCLGAAFRDRSRRSRDKRVPYPCLRGFQAFQALPCRRREVAAFSST